VNAVSGWVQPVALAMRAAMTPTAIECSQKSRGSRRSPSPKSLNCSTTLMLRTAWSMACMPIRKTAFSTESTGSPAA